MALDPHRFPLLSDEIIASLQQPDVLLEVSVRETAVLHVPTETAHSSTSGFCGAELEQLIEAATGAGAVVIDARPCDIDAFVSLVITGPMPAVGPMKRWRIDGSRHALSSLAIEDYAPLYAAIGAVVHNLPMPDGEAAEAAA